MANDLLKSAYGANLMRVDMVQTLEDEFPGECNHSQCTGLSYFACSLFSLLLFSLILLFDPLLSLSVLFYYNFLCTPLLYPSLVPTYLGSASILLPEFKVVCFKAGEHIYSKGDRSPTGCCFVLEGRVEMVRDGEGEALYITGEHFAEVTASSLL